MNWILLELSLLPTCPCWWQLVHYIREKMLEIFSVVLCTPSGYHIHIINNSRKFCSEEMPTCVQAWQALRHTEPSHCPVHTQTRPSCTADTDHRSCRSTTTVSIRQHVCNKKYMVSQKSSMCLVFALLLLAIFTIFGKKTALVTDNNRLWYSHICAEKGR